MPSIDPVVPRKPRVPRWTLRALPPRLSVDDTDEKKSTATEVYSTYEISERKLQEYLRGLFARNDYKVTIIDDHYHMKLPRAFSEEERKHLEELRPREQDFRDNFATNEKLHIPWIIPSPEGKLVITGESTGSKDSYEIVTSQLDVDSWHSSDYLYGARISDGMTCQVFEITARWIKASEQASGNTTSQTVKLAVKRFSGNTTWRQILREYKALRAVKKRPHPNIVEVLSAFYYGDQDVYFNLSFSLAVGNLKQLFRGTLNGSSVAGEFETLWSQFEGLAGAVSHLHNECDIAHTDLKPSNVLLYRTGGTPPLVCKIADFGLAVELPDRSTTFESRWAWKYDAPEPRPPPELRAEMARNKPPDSSSPRYLEGPPDSKLSARGDIWKLGAIFTELSTFLVFGAKGVYDFRQRITTTRENFTSDGLSDSLFDDGMFGDGVKVKFEVLDWIRVLRQYNPFVAEIAVLLHQMFAEDYNKRPSAARLFAQLQQTSLCSYFDEVRQIQFIRQKSVPPLSWVDKIKESAETYLGSPIDWWPLRHGNRRCPPCHSRIIWEYSTYKLYVDVPDAAVLEYKKHCVPISRVPTSPILPLHTVPGSSRETQGQSSQQAIQVPYQPYNQPFLMPALPGRDSNDPNLSTVATVPSITALPTLPKDIHWCVDRSWSEPKETYLCSIQNVHQIRDDSILCQRLKNEYQRVRTWKGRIFSWKRCLGVEFINFNRVLANEQRILKITTGLPSVDHDNYEYSLRKPEIVHMALASEQLVIGIHSPQTVSGISTTLSMIPKCTVTPLSLDAGAEGWGIHALQRFSLMKIMWWVIGLTFVGIVFVICWLVFVSKTDLQNAFIPFTFLAGMVMVGLAVPQLLDVD